jgi:gas vesicle protein
MDNGSRSARTAGAGIGGLFMGIMLGAIIGGVVALLFAPQPGTQTRGLVKDRFGQFKDVFRSGAHQMGQAAEKTAEQMKRGFQEKEQGG